MRKHWMTVAAGATLLTVLSAGANAGVATNGAALTEIARNSSAVEKAATRRCWTSNGIRRCKVYQSAEPQVYGFGYGYGPAYDSYYYSGNSGTGYHVGSQPEEFRTGSTAWWRAMDAEDRGGFGD